MTSSKFIIVLLGLVLAGCAVGPDFRTPDIGLPTGWSFGKREPSAGTDPAGLARWWRKFHDPILNELVEEAAGSNIEVKIAVTRVNQARAARQSAASAFWPDLSASGGGQQSDVGGTGPGSGNFRSYRGGLSSVWELDLFGGDRRGYESAAARFAAAGAELDATRLAMAAEVAQTYCQLRSTQDQLAVAKRNLVTQQHSAEITRKRRVAGFASDLDVANADALVANTQAQIPRLETSARQSIHAVSVLLGRMPGDLLGKLSAVRPIPTVTVTVPTGIPSDILRRRPDIRVAEANAHAATAKIGVAVADLFPRFSITGSLSQQSARLADWLSPSARVTSLGPSFNWALFQGGNIQANIRLQQALRDEAVLSYRKTVLTALQEVEDALVASANEHKRRSSLADAVAANRRAEELSVKLYTEGQADFLNVLNAQRSLLQSENDFSQSNLALATDLIALYKALGGGW